LAQPVADTTYFGSPRRLWIFELEPAGHRLPASVQRLRLQRLVEEATVSHKPRRGPWVWPMFDAGLAKAIMVANIDGMQQANNPMPWPMRLVWFLRLPSPPVCYRGQDVLAMQFVKAVSYAFMWSNYYVQGLWILAISLMLFSIFEVSIEAEDYGTSARSIGWFVLQFWAVLWSEILIDEGDRREPSFITELPSPRPGLPEPEEDEADSDGGGRRQHLQRQPPPTLLDSARCCRHWAKKEPLHGSGDDFDEMALPAAAVPARAPEEAVLEEKTGRRCSGSCGTALFGDMWKRRTNVLGKIIASCFVVLLQPG